MGEQMLHSYFEFAARLVGATAAALWAGVFLGIIAYLFFMMMFARDIFDDPSLAARRAFGLAAAALIWPVAMYVAFWIVP